ncbi:hypothetical protein HDV62DRAFT_342146 [Trichoderma sp. SZMC 28011]
MATIEEGSWRCCCRVVYTSNSRLHILDPSLHSCIPYPFMQLGLVIQQLNKIKFKKGSACTGLYRTVCVQVPTLLQSNSTKVIANRSRGPGVPVTWALLAFSNTSAQHSSFDAPRGWVSRIRAVSHLYARGRCRTESTRTELLYSTVFSMDFLFLASIHLMGFVLGGFGDPSHRISWTSSQSYAPNPATLGLLDSVNADGP